MSVTIIKTFKNAGQTSHIYEVRTGDARAVFSDVGATWISFFVRGRDGKIYDILKGPRGIEDLKKNSGSKGAVIGRNANRIAGGRFQIDQETFVLPKNDGNNNLHSGPDNYKFRTYRTHFDSRGTKITFSLFSPDGDQGFPGNMHLTVTYTLLGSALFIGYEAVSDKKTVINLTNHAYFNLEGAGSGDIRTQSAEICADAYLPVGRDLIPKEKASVKGTPMDFRGGRTIGAALKEEFSQLKIAGGFDHCYFVQEYDGTMKKCASAASGKTGIHMDVYTDLPCLQFYTGNGLEEKRSAYCFETQFPPDGVNRKGDICPLFDAGEVYAFHTVYSVRNV